MGDRAYSIRSGMANVLISIDINDPDLLRGPRPMSVLEDMMRLRSLASHRRETSKSDALDLLQIQWLALFKKLAQGRAITDSDKEALAATLRRIGPLDKPGAISMVDIEGLSDYLAERGLDALLPPPPNQGEQIG